MGGTWFASKLSWRDVPGRGHCLITRRYFKKRRLT